MHPIFPRNQVFDAVVFGSGLAGLSCSRRLAVRGKKVIVLEKAKELGGHLLPFERGGVVFEVGLHYIADTHPGSHFSAAVAKLNVEFEQIFLDNEFETLVFEGGGRSAKEQISYSRPTTRFIADLKFRFPQFTLSIERYFQTLELVWGLARQLKFPVAVKDVLATFWKSEHKLLLARLATQTLGEYLDELGIFGQLREILVVHHLLIGVPPSKVSALTHMTVQRYYFEAASFVRGGGRAMIEALKHVDVDYLVGVDAQFERVFDVEFARQGIRYRVWTGDGQEFYAKSIVWTPDPRLLAAGNTTVSLPSLVREKMRRAEAPHALVVGYFATRKPLQDYGFSNRNYWLMGNLDSEQCYLESDPQQLAQSAPLYLSMGSLRDPDAVQSGHKLAAKGVFQAMFLCPPESAPWGGSDADAYRVPESKGGFGRAYRMTKEQVLKTLTQRIVTQWPQLQGELQWTELGTPLTHRRYLNSLTLNGYGYAATVSDLLWKRPGAWTGEDGLYLCGAHVRPSHGIVTALLNGVGLADCLATCETPT
ncbi:NAD(P)/FAD-dependent oxidoreductase [bacterium]|nr:NAD(P)/FAD-dependent oxidoreductase [bacterium]